MILFIVILLAVCIVLFFLTQVIMLYKDKDLTRKDFTISGMMENLKEDDIAHNRKSASSEFIKLIRKICKKKK